LPRCSLFMVGKAQKSHAVRSGLYGGCSVGVPPIHFFQAEFRSRPMRFLGFSNHENGAPRQEIPKWSTVCSTFSISGWSVVRSASLAKGRTSKKRPSSHLHKVPTRSNKVSPRTFQTALFTCRDNLNTLRTVSGILVTASLNWLTTQCLMRHNTTVRWIVYIVKRNWRGLFESIDYPTVFCKDWWSHKNFCQYSQQPGTMRWRWMQSNIFTLLT
jgi:hypothetical protein